MGLVDHCFVLLVFCVACLVFVTSAPCLVNGLRRLHGCRRGGAGGVKSERGWSGGYFYFGAVFDGFTIEGGGGE